MLIRTRGLGQHRAVGSAGYRPGPPARRQQLAHLSIIIALFIPIGLALTSSQPTGTRALFTSSAAPQSNSLKSGEWGLQTPAECADRAFEDVIVLQPADNPYTAHSPHGPHGYLIFGTSGDDTIIGSNKDDCIVGGDGDDTLFGVQGDDVLIGGTGMDDLSGGTSHDMLYGGDGDDTLHGDNGPDKGLYGGDGDDAIFGDNGPDVVDGGGGDDTCTLNHAPGSLKDCEHTP